LNICFAYKEDYPWDVRVEKITKSFHDRGDNVELVCRNLDQRETNDLIGGVRVHRLPKFNFLPRFIRLLLNAPVFFNPFWLYLLFIIVRRTRSDLIIVRDLPLMMAGIIVGKFTGTKVVFDMAECYPEMYRSSMEAVKVSFLTRIVKSPRLAEFYERISVKWCDHVFVMIEESKSRLINKEVDENKITIVSNTPIIESSVCEPKAHHGEALSIIYVGFLTKIRGLDLLIKAVRRCLDSSEGSSQIQVNIIGEGSDKNNLERLVKDLNLENNVKVHGWLSHESAREYMSSANVGCLTYRFCGHWNHTIPNKIFDYMRAGLPVLTTNVKPISRIIESEECGLSSSDSDIDEIARNLTLLKDPSLRQRLGNNGQAAVMRQYNWSVELERMFRAADLLARRPIAS
jgi:glycosyltransferase involved in cell wall biosynthesis